VTPVSMTIETVAVAGNQVLVAEKAMDGVEILAAVLDAVAVLQKLREDTEAQVLHEEHVLSSKDAHHIDPCLDMLIPTMI